MWGKTLRGRADRDWGEGRRVVSLGLGFTIPGPHSKAWRQTAAGGTPVRLDCYLQGREPVKIRVNKDIFR